MSGFPRPVARPGGTRAAAAAGLAVLAGLAVVAAGAMVLVAPAAAVSSPADTGVPPPVHPASAAAAGPTGTARPAVPRGIDIPALHLHAGVVPVTAPAGDLGVPDDPRLVGWWSPGARPASPTGTVVLAGHVDTAARGLGAFAALARVELGMHVRVTTASGAVDYVVAARVRYPKASLPDEVFAQYGPPRLVLITCGGRFDPAQRRYADNIVVFAVPATGSPT